MKASRSTQKKRTVLIVTGAIVVVAVFLYLLGYAHKSDSGTKPQTVNPSPQQTQKEAQDAAQSSGNGTQKTSSVGGSLQGNGTPGSGSGSSASGPAPAAPTGDFVSAHTVSSSAPVSSVCNSTPGASCTITFANGSTTKSLTAQTVGSNGSTSWNWTAGSLLGSGTWTVTAVATLNGKTSSATDATNLTVQ
jgi:hypothetical protein